MPQNHYATRDVYGVTNHYNVVISHRSIYTGWLASSLSSHRSRDEAEAVAADWHAKTGRYCRVEYWGKSGMGSEEILREFGQRPEGMEA